MQRVSLSVAFLILIVSGAALAIYGQPVRIVGEDASEIRVQDISFSTETGTVVEVRDDDDNDGIVLLFPGDRPEAGRMTISRPGGDYDIAVPALMPGDTLIVDTDRRIAYPAGHPPADTPAGTGYRPGLRGNGVVDLTLGYDALRLDAPISEFGTRIGSGGEFPVVRMPREIDLTGGTIGGRLPFSGRYSALGSLSRSQGSDSSTGQVAAGTDNVGMVYQDFSPSDATGVFLGNTGLDVLVDRDVDVWNAKFGIGWDCNWGRSHGGSFHPKVFFDYAQIDTDIEAWVTSPTYSDISQHTRQNISEDLFTLGIGGTYVYPFSPRIYGGLGGSVFATYSDADFTSVQTNVCGLCGSGNNFTSTVRDSRTDTGFGADLRVSLEFWLTDGFGLFAQYQNIWLDEFATLDMPISGNDLFIDNDPVDFHDGDGTTSVRQARLGARFRF